MKRTGLEINLTKLPVVEHRQGRSAMTNFEHAKKEKKESKDECGADDTCDGHF